MTWDELLAKFADMPLFHSSLLDIFPDDHRSVQVQLSRWTAAGKLRRIRRGWYLIEKSWRRKDVSIPFIATQIVQPSYLSLDWAFQYYSLIPEGVSNPTCLTTSRPLRIQVLDRMFLYHCIQPKLFSGFVLVSFDADKAPVALPEKALFDKIYLFTRRSRFSLDWIRELRLENLDHFDLDLFASFAKTSGKRSLESYVQMTADFIREERQ
jgi:hypothetical protein